MVAHDHDPAVGHVSTQSFTFLAIGACDPVIVIADHVSNLVCLLGQRQQAGFHAGYRHTRAGMTVQRHVDIGPCLQHRGVDRMACLVVGVVPLDDIAIEVDLDQVARANLVKQQAVGIDQVLPRVIGHPGA